MKLTWKWPKMARNVPAKFTGYVTERKEKNGSEEKEKGKKKKEYRKKKKK